MAKEHRTNLLPRSLEEAYAQWSQIDPANIEGAEYWIYTSLLPRLLELCADAVQRRCYNALGMWLYPTPPLTRLYSRLGAHAAERVMHLIEIAADAVRLPTPPANPADADLHTYFRTGRWRSATHTVRLAVALADPETPEHAFPLTLILERIPDVDTSYAHPALHWLLHWDALFQSALDDANLHGVRWSLTPLPLHASIQGDSLGGAFALGAQLLRSRYSDCRRIAVLARYNPETQQLMPVEQFQEKLDAVLATRGVHTVLVSRAQVSGSLPRTVAVSTLEEAVRYVRASVRRQRAVRLSLVTPILPLLGFIWGLQQGSYTFTVTPSGRLMIETGLIPRTRIDTGYLAADVYPDQLALGRRWRWQMTPAELDIAPYREIAEALIDPFLGARLHAYLGNPERALKRLPPPDTPILSYRFQRLETLQLLQPQRRAEWAQLAHRTPAPDPASRFAQLHARYLLGDLSRAAFVRRLKPLALPPHDAVLRLDALAIIAHDDPDWILQSGDLKAFLKTASIHPVLRGRALRVLTVLSQQRLVETLPLIEPFYRDPVIQGGRHHLDRLVRMLLQREESFYFTEREYFDDVHLSNRVEVECLELVFEGLLSDFARARPTLRERWEFLLSDLESPFAARWAAHRGALTRAILRLTPPSERSALRQYLQQQLQRPRPIHQRLALLQALERLLIPQNTY